MCVVKTIKQTKQYSKWFDFGPGYRVYYTERNGEIVVLLAGGDKSTQKQDIEKAKQLATTV